MLSIRIYEFVFVVDHMMAVANFGQPSICFPAIRNNGGASMKQTSGLWGLGLTHLASPPQP